MFLGDEIIWYTRIVVAVKSAERNNHKCYFFIERENLKNVSEKLAEVIIDFQLQQKLSYPYFINNVDVWFYHYKLCEKNWLVCGIKKIPFMVETSL